MKRLLTTILYTFIFLSGSGQLPIRPQPVYIHYNSVNSGLPTEMVYKIVADNYGYIWLATDKGLVMYNGKEFTNVNVGRFEDVISIYKTKENMLWLVTYARRTWAIDLSSHHVVNTDSLYGPGKIKQAGTNIYKAILQWGSKIILLQTNYKYPGIVIDLATNKSVADTITSGRILAQYKLPPTIGKHDLKKELDTILQKKNIGIHLKKDNLIIGNKVFQVKEHAAAVLLFDGDDYGIPGYIEAAVRHGDDLYIGGLNNLGLIRVAGFFNHPGGRCVLEKILPAEQVTDIESDYLDNIWVSTLNNGIFFFPGSEFNTLYYNKSSGLHSNNVTSFSILDTGITVIGYNNACADFIYRDTVRRFRVPVHQYIREILHAEKNNNLWLLFTRLEAFAAYTRNSGQTLPAAFAKILCNRSDAVVVGYKNGTLLNHSFYYAGGADILCIDSLGSQVCLYRPKLFSPGKKTCVLPLSENKMITGTPRGGFVNTIQLPYLADDQFFTIRHIDSLIVYCTNTGAYAIPEKQLLKKTFLKKIAAGAICDIRHDDLFFYLRSSNEELVTINRKTLETVQVRSLKKYYIPFKLNDFFADKKYLVLAGNQGIFYIPKNTSPDTAAQVTPLIHIQSSLYGFSPNNSVFECTYRKDFSASFKLDILDYKNESVPVSYRVLRNGKEQYSQTGIDENTRMNFVPASPGQYDIEYRASFGPSVPDQVVSFTIIIHPAWYQQTWFLSLVFIVSVVLMYYITSRISGYRARQNQKKLEQELHIRELEAKSLLGQLKPHFVFNLLTPLQGYFLKEQKLEGLTYLSSFSGLMRSLLKGMGDKYTTLQAELDFAEQYLDVQQKRFDNRFSYQVSVAADVTPAAYMIPALLIQPLLENAVEHGIIKKGGPGGSIVISIGKKEDVLVITITDNGAGLPPDFVLKNNHALAIITERVALLKKTSGAGSFRIENRAPPLSGASAVLILPAAISL